MLMGLLGLLMILMSSGGYSASTTSSSTSSSRGLRNNNPGNIRKSPVTYLGEIKPSQDSSFKQFETMAYGYRAMLMILNVYLKRSVNWNNNYLTWKPSAQSGKIDTIYKVINTWAPASDNNPTQTYVNFVSQATGIAQDKKLTFVDFVPIA